MKINKFENLQKDNETKLNENKIKIINKLIKKLKMVEIDYDIKNQKELYKMAIKQSNRLKLFIIWLFFLQFM